MVVFGIIVLILLLGFWFFSPPKVKTFHASADVETRSGRTTFFHYRSKIDKGKGEIILVHGLCENHLYFEQVAEKLTGAGYDCYAINLFGYGGSFANQPRSYTVQAYAQQIVEVVRELERLRLLKSLVAVWGHSMGGSAVYLASSEIVRDNPEIQAIVLENPGFGENFTFLSNIIKPFASLANFRGARSLLQPFFNMLFASSARNEKAARYMKNLLRYFAPRREVAVANVDSVAKLSFSPEEVSESTLSKMQAAFSQKDKLFGFSRVRKSIIEPLKSKPNFEDEQLLTLPEADHFISLQAPGEIADFVLGRLRKKDTKFSPQSV